MEVDNPAYSHDTAGWIGMSSSFSFIDLFAGIGGFHYALEENGGECVWASEIDTKAAAAYQANHSIVPAGDITEVAAENIPEHDLIAAGFPCQTFSVAGNRLGLKDIRGTLFREIVRIADYHRPKVLFLENVRNFATHDKGRTLETVRNSITEIGYNFYSSPFVASDFGVPQARRRYIMVAIRKDIDPDESFEFPEPPKTPVRLEEILEDPSDVTEDLRFKGDVVFAPEKFIKEGETLNAPRQIGTISKGRQGERVYDIRGHAVTLSASGGGPGGSTGLYLTDEDVVRKLTPREAARAQGFPEDFKLPESKNSAWKMFGNAVPVPMISHIGTAIKEFL